MKLNGKMKNRLCKKAYFCSDVNKKIKKIRKSLDEANKACNKNER